MMEGGGHYTEGGVKPGSSVAVGYAFMAKKMDSMAKVVSVDPCDGVEFHPLDFSQPPGDYRQLDVILHKLSDDIMFRDDKLDGNLRLRWIEEYLKRHPETVLVDPIEKVSKVINRITTLELLAEAYRTHGAAGGMPRPPRYVVLQKNEASDDAWRGLNGNTSGGGLAFPVICKPIEACGTRGSHRMVIVLDEAGMGALTRPIVVQECSNHGAKLFKVCVVGDDVRVYERPSLPDLPPGLMGSFTFDSQKPYPTLEEVKAVSAAAAKERKPAQIPPPATSETPHAVYDPGDVENPSSLPSLGMGNGEAVRGATSNGTIMPISRADLRDEQDGDNAVKAGKFMEAPGETAMGDGVNGKRYRNGVVEAAAAVEVEKPANGDRQVQQQPEQPQQPHQPRQLEPEQQQQQSEQQQHCVTRSSTYAKTSPSSRTTFAPRDSTVVTQDRSSSSSSSSYPSDLSPTTLNTAPELQPSASSGEHRLHGSRVATQPAAAFDKAGLGLGLGDNVSPTPYPAVSLSIEAARLAAVRMRETFGLSIFGFDVIVDRASGELMVIDVNYFPSFKDLDNFPQVLRQRLKDVVADAGR